jgi:hypothetical protein
LCKLQLFSHAYISFGLNGERFQSSPVHATPSFSTPMTTNDTSRNITVPLMGRMGRYVRIQLVFTAPLILLSEISFESGAFCRFFPLVYPKLAIPLRVLQFLSTETSLMSCWKSFTGRKFLLKTQSGLH